MAPIPDVPEIALPTSDYVRRAARRLAAGNALDGTVVPFTRETVLEDLRRTVDLIGDQPQARGVAKQAADELCAWLQSSSFERPPSGGAVMIRSTRTGDGRATTQCNRREPRRGEHAVNETPLVQANAASIARAAPRPVSGTIEPLGPRRVVSRRTGREPRRGEHIATDTPLAQAYAASTARKELRPDPYTIASLDVGQVMTWCNNHALRCGEHIVDDAPLMQTDTDSLARLAPRTERLALRTEPNTNETRMGAKPATCDLPE